MANNEWGTPEKYIESARLVMGSINVDPASNDDAQKTVKAAKYFTLDNKADIHDLYGNVWLNPPYGRGLAKPIVSMVAHAYKLKIIKQAIILTNNVPDTDWWSKTIGNQCSCVCLLDHRIAFINPETGKPERGNDRNQIFTYLGRDVRSFINEFSQYGLCCLPMR